MRRRVLAPRRLAGPIAIGGGCTTRGGIRRFAVAEVERFLDAGAPGRPTCCGCLATTKVPRLLTTAESETACAVSLATAG